MRRNKGSRCLITFLVVGLTSAFLAGCGGKQSEGKVLVELIEGLEEPLKITYNETITIPKDNFKITIYLDNGDIDLDPDPDKLQFSSVDKSIIGDEQTVVIEYDGKQVDELKVLVEKAELPHFSIGYKDDKISWDQVSGAEKYRVYINDREVETISSSKNTEYLLNNYDYPSDVYKVKIEAIPKDNIRYKSSYTKELEIKKLPNPDNVVYKDGKISWDAVVKDKSCKYVVTINGKVYKETYDTFVVYNMLEGENNVEIKALACEDYVTSSNSTACNFKKLEPIEETISYNKGKIVWNAPDQKCKYRVRIDDEEYETTETSYEYSLEIGKVYTVEIWAVADDKYTLDSESVKQTLQYNRLDKPELAVQQGKTDVNYILEILNFKENTKYNVEIIRYVDDVQDAVFYDNLKDSKLEFEVGKDVTKIVVKVKAVDEKGAYAESYVAEIEQKIAHNKLMTPQVTITQGEFLGSYIISYPAVSGADKYRIEVISITDVERVSKVYNVSVTQREIELREDTVAIEVRVTAYNESGVHDESDTAIVKRKITW